MVDPARVELMKAEPAVVDTTTPHPIRFDTAMVSMERVSVSMIGPAAFDLVAAHTIVVVVVYITGVADNEVATV